MPGAENGYLQPMIVLVPVIVLVLGLLMWSLAKTNPIVSEAGRIMFFCGVLVFTLVAANQAVSLFGGAGERPAIRSR